MKTRLSKNDISDLLLWTRSLIGIWRNEVKAPTLTAKLADQLRTLRITPLVFRALKSSFPPEIALVQEDYRNELSRNIVRFHHIKNLRDRLKSRGIDLMLLKGGAFLVRFGKGDLGLRATADLDLAILPSKLQEVVSYLSEQGYEGFSDRPIKNSDHHAIYMGKREGSVNLHLDLHRSIGPLVGHKRLLEALLSRPDHRNDWCLPETDLWIWSIAVHRLQSGFMSDLRELFDFALLAESTRPETLFAYGNLFDALGGLYLTAKHSAFWTGSEEAKELAENAPISKKIKQSLDLIFPPLSPILVSSFRRNTFFRRTIAMPLTTFSPVSSLVESVKHAIFLQN